MRHPFWLINSALILIAGAILAFVFLSRQKPPIREDIEPDPYVKPIVTATSRVNISKIYEDDLFGTYQREIPQIQPLQDIVLPEPPQPQQPRTPEEPKPQFLDPLSITLKGVIVVLDDDQRNRAIISDNKTNQETAYKIGDKIEDAQLIRIFNNKVLFLRSNGQQEVIYLRERDAKHDPLYATIDNWISVVAPIGTNKFRVIINEFVQRVPSLGQFIDMLDLTTVYRQGESIGCRIGQLSSDSLGTALGFAKGDIISSVNNKSVATTSDRFSVYQEITSLKTNDTVSVILLRNNQPITLTFTLQEAASPAAKVAESTAKNSEMNKEQIQALAKKESFAPTLQEIKNKEKQLMFQKGKRPTQNVLSTITE